MSSLIVKDKHTQKRDTQLLSEEKKNNIYLKTNTSRLFFIWLTRRSTDTRACKSVLFLWIKESVFYKSIFFVVLVSQSLLALLHIHAKCFIVQYENNNHLSYTTSKVEVFLFRMQQVIAQYHVVQPI